MKTTNKSRYTMNFDSVLRFVQTMDANMLANALLV